MKVEPQANAVLEKIHKAVVGVVDSLKQVYGKDFIQMNTLKNFQAHVSLYSGLPQSFLFPKDVFLKGAKFIPLCLQLRDNDRVLYTCSTSHSATLKSKADQ